MQPKPKALSIASIALLATLSGCASWNTVDERKEEDSIVKVDRVDKILSDAAVSISDSYKRLAEVSTKSTVAVPVSITVPPSLSRKVTINWNGPIEGVIAELAAVAQYKFRVIGDRPSVPVMVAVSAKDESLSEIIRDIGFQSDARADVAVLQSVGTIEVRYKGVTSAPSGMVK